MFCRPGFLSLLCFFVVCGKQVFGQESNDTFTFDDFLTSRYGAFGFGGVWVSDNQIQLQQSGDVVILNVETNKTDILLSGDVLSENNADSYWFSADGNLVLISYNTRSQFRHSTTAQFLVYSLVNKQVTNVANGAFLQTARWGPVVNSLLYVFDNDIYYTPQFSVMEEIRITNSGIPGVIYNGVPDWVYEEEVIEAATAHWFSPDGNGLVYIQFNDTEVQNYVYEHYGQPGTIEDQYPTQISIRYPKSGARNPSHTAFYVNLTGGNYTSVPVRADLNGNTVTYGVVWAGNETFTELVKNRVQNESTLTICDATTLDCTPILEKANPIGWDITSVPIFDSVGRYYLNFESIGDGVTYRHLVLRDSKNVTFFYPLTSGSRVVVSVIDWDESANVIYYSATEELKPWTTQVYRVNVNGGNSSCLTCGIITPEGNPCTSASAQFSRGFTYVIATCSGPDPRVVSLYENSETLGEPIQVLQGNEALRESLKSKALPTIFSTTVPTAEGFHADVRLFLPPNFNESKKYPLLIEVYGGPDYFQITDDYSVGWKTYLSSSLGVIYGLIDGRGCGRRGDDVLFAGYRNLGTVEIYDQINVTRQLQESYPFIDSTRSAIWGWSYGGFATGRVMELDTDGAFKCGISVAPVTSWLYYDSIYTERYMGLPSEEDNGEGYTAGDLVSHVENIRAKQYYLIHGNADDNVHYQQSMLLSRALEINDILFQQQSYPDENHSLGGVSLHLYHSMDKFWKNCFELDELSAK